MGEPNYRCWPDLEKRLRALRLWHWRECLSIRDTAQQLDGPEWLKDNMNLDADFHLAQVQLLNEFFPVGDTAEGDDK